MKKILVISCCILFLISMSSLVKGPEFKPHIKAVNKAINKIWKISEFEIIDNNEISCDKSGYWYNIISNQEELGFIYVGRINSCRSGGCSVNLSEEAIAYEYFDYMLFTNTQGKVLWVKIFNYQATQGHEVMSRGWLNQFKGVHSGTTLEFGRDIESISGATVSATALTNDIQNVLSCAF